MNLGIPRASDRLLVPLLLLYSFALLATGHHSPGGGFAGGLTAAAAFILRSVLEHPAHDASSDDRLSGHLLVAGLLVLALSALAGPVAGEPLLTKLEAGATVPPEVPLATDFLFDVGVYLVSCAAGLIILRTLIDPP